MGRIYSESSTELSGVGQAPVPDFLGRSVYNISSCRTIFSYLGFRAASSLFRDSGFEDEYSYLVVPYNETLGHVNLGLCVFYAPVLWIEETAYGELRIGRSIPLFGLD